MSRRPVPSGRTSALLIAILALLTAVLVSVFIVRLAHDQTTKANVGTQEFAVGRSTVMARRVAVTGPFLFEQLRGAAPDLYVQHLGHDPAHGWLAFAARPDGAPQRCDLVWTPLSNDFEQAKGCPGPSYPADGQGLLHYQARVDPKGVVVINLRQSTGTGAVPN